VEGVFPICSADFEVSDELRPKRILQRNPHQ